MPHPDFVDPEDRAWLAGLLEGEGSFNCSCEGSLRIQIGMIDEDIISRAASLLGADVWGPYQYGERQPYFRTGVSGPAARTWMEALRPLMGGRRQEQIDTALEDYDKDD